MKLSKIIISCLLAFQVQAFAKKNVTVEIKTTEGTMVLELDAQKAPKTVKNFVSYAKSKFYDGTVFHRVIKGFMVQGGGFTFKNGALDQKTTKKSVKNEAKNGLKNKRGTIAMARTSDPHSATAQFFINHNDNTNLDYPSFDGWGYAVFGKLTKGADVLDKIAAVKTGMNSGMKDVPVKEVKIISIKVK